MTEKCPHEAALPPLAEIEIVGCEQCLAIGDTWVNLRRCLSCGQVGCCDSSKNKHASKHIAANADHSVMRSVMPGETWRYCAKCKLTWEPNA